ERGGGGRDQRSKIKDLLPSGGNEVEVLASLRAGHVLRQREAHRGTALGLVEDGAVGVCQPVVSLLVTLVHRSSDGDGEGGGEQAQQEEALHGRTGSECLRKTGSYLNTV
ncbi:hypothetical protein PMAYCL1PPCAC_31973, partial [Pristionchus mayeri]